MIQRAEVRGGRAAGILAAIIIAAALVRLPSLLHDGLWRDEAYVYVAVTAPSFRGFMQRVIASEYHPPLYFVICYFWVKLVGATELSLKLLPFFFSLLTVPAVYWLGKTAASRSTGLLAAALYAMSPLAIAYSSGGYVYSLASLLLTVLAYLVMSARREPSKPGRLGAVALVTALVVYTHYFALFFVPMLAFWAVLSRKGARHAAILTSSIAFGALTFLLWLPTFLIQRRAEPFVAPSSAHSKVLFAISTLLQFMPARPPALALLFLLSIAAGVIVLCRAHRLNADASVMGLLFFAVLFCACATNVISLRYLLPFIGLLYAFLASIIVGCVQAFKLDCGTAWALWRIASALVLCTAFSVENVLYVLRASAVPRSGIRSFVAAERLDRGTLYVIAPDYMAATFAFYARNSHVFYTGFVRGHHPEITRWANYLADWQARNAVALGAEAIQRSVRRYEYMDMIMDEAATGVTPIPYVKIWQLLSVMEGRFRLVESTRYAGRDEAIVVYRFRVR
jgi:4-amino-4-deoxy-L-arabinose transferase-like glycosyltransferase